jgi:glycosyltransferase involved in cell wall biosynthesis
MMRVLYLAGWVDVSTRLLIERVAAQDGVWATVLTTCDKSPQCFSDRVAVERFRSRGKLDLGAVRDLRHSIDAGGYDVVHALSSRLLANTLLATRSLPHAPAVCGFMGHVSRFSSYNPVHRMTYLHPRLAAVSCNCRAVAEPLIRSGAAEKKLFTIYGGLEPTVQKSVDSSVVRDELGIPRDALIVGFTGNMRRVKGVDVLLQAALQLKDLPPLHWLLLGRVEDARVARLAERREIRDRVHCLGWRDDAARLMAAMDIFAMPSRSEGLCRAIMEAMALGLCPVATTVGGTPELIRDGVDGLVVPSGDASALASAIRRVAGDTELRKRLACSARQRIRSDFTIERMVEGTLGMYRAVLARECGGRRRAA